MLAALISSVGNFAAGVTIARSAGVDDFGQFSIAFTVYALVLGITQAAIGERVIVDSARGLTSNRWGSVAVLGVGSGVASLLAGVILANAYLVLLAFGMPGLALFGYIRGVSLAVRDPVTGLLLDAAWTTVVVCCLIATIYHPVDAIALFAVWVLSGAMIGLVRAGLELVRYHRDRRPIDGRWSIFRVGRSDVAFGLDYLLGAGSAQITVLLVGAVAGLGAVAALRGGGTLLAPVSVAQVAFVTVLLPSQVRAMVLSSQRQWRQSKQAVRVLVPSVTGAVLAILLLPDSIGTTLLGATWPSAESVLPLLGLESVAAAAASVAFIGVRAHRDARSTLLIRGFLAPVRIIIVGFMAYIGGAIGAASGMAGVALISMVIWWWGFRWINLR